MSQDREMKIFMASAAQKARRYEESVNFFKAAVLLDPKLSESEQKLFLQVYKSCVDLRRNDILFISSIKEYQQCKKCTLKVDALDIYQKKLYNELAAFCYEVISLIDNFILVKASSPEETVLYLKTKADFYRYLAETLSEQDGFPLSSKAHELYLEAINTSKSSILPTHPVYCNTILNYSVYLHEILKHKSDALIIAEDFVEKIKDLEQIDQEPVSEETHQIIQRIKQNVDMWKKESNNNSDSDAES
ncbi:hypothetical protein M9Y10_017454 [Tritrichomonas musculus]|uniref:14-3-3 domain-containing protein n=1 Tax=Tritrichomonas musculus TaxID=1915356 RepID=A0ABR2HU11_9EUKA